MRTEINKVNLNRIMFETGDNSILLSTTIQKGNLSYASEMIVENSELNKILNQIQKQVDENVEISSLFETEKMYDGNLLYILDLNKKINQIIDIQNLIKLQEIKKIRA
jgi:hypothetical protein